MRREEEVEFSDMRRNWDDYMLRAALPDEVAEGETAVLRCEDAETGERKIWRPTVIAV